jgi:hypothetical protein
MARPNPAARRTAALATVALLLGVGEVRASGPDRPLPVDPEALAPLWRAAANPDPLPPLGLPARAAGCAVVAFTIDADGRPRDLAVVSANPTEVYGEAGRRVVEHRRYAPGRDNPDARPVSTFEIVTFGPRQPRTGSRLARGADPALFAPCDLRPAEVAARLAEARAGG